MERGNSPDLDDIATRRDYLFGAGSIAVFSGMAGCLGLGGNSHKSEESDGEIGTNDSADEDAEDGENGDEDGEDDDGDDDDGDNDDSNDDEDADAGDNDSALEKESEDDDIDDESSDDRSEDQNGGDNIGEDETNEDEEGDSNDGEANDGEGEDDDTGDERTDGANEESNEDDATDDDGDDEAEEEEDDEESDEEEDGDENDEGQEERDSSAARYTNDEYGYELEYPTEWVVEEGDDYVQILDGDETARIWVEFAETSLDLDQGVQNYRETFNPNPGVELHEDDPMTLSSGEEGHRFVIEITDTERNQIFAHELIAHVNGIQYLSSVIISRSEYNEDYAQLAEEILASVALY